MNRVKLVQFQVIVESVYDEALGRFRDKSVLYALDSNGSLWRKRFTKWEEVKGPHDE